MRQCNTTSTRPVFGFCLTYICCDGLICSWVSSWLKENCNSIFFKHMQDSYASLGGSSASRHVVCGQVHSSNLYQTKKDKSRLLKGGLHSMSPPSQEVSYVVYRSKLQKGEIFFIFWNIIGLHGKMISCFPAPPVSLNCACGILRSKGQEERLWSQLCQTEVKANSPLGMKAQTPHTAQKSKCLGSKSFVSVFCYRGESFFLLSFRIDHFYSWSTLNTYTEVLFCFVLSKS